MERDDYLIGRKITKDCGTQFEIIFVSQIPVGIKVKRRGKWLANRKQATVKRMLWLKEIREDEAY